ncbi:MAG: type II toxin-antitoxin system HicA family toxin [Lentisphaeria bacterium]|nr:type II toxin-antitoxin system HicA family toxin [Lentisphaeria bacterium]
MPRFPVDAPLREVMAALERLGFKTVREGSHIAMLRENTDGTRTPLTIPDHQTLKSSTLGTIRTRAGIAREDFLRVFRE